MSSVLLCATQSKPMANYWPTKSTLFKIISENSLKNIFAGSKIALGTAALIASPFIGNAVFNHCNSINEEPFHGYDPHCYGCIQKRNEAFYAGFSLFAITAFASYSLFCNGYNQLIRA